MASNYLKSSAWWIPRGCSVACCITLCLASSLSYAQDSIPYTEIFPDANALPPDQETDFKTNYIEIKAGAYTTGTVDPRTVYKEMGNGFDDEEMVITEPARDPSLILPPPTVIPFDAYAGMNVVITPAQKIKVSELLPEDRIFLKIYQAVDDPELMESFEADAEPKAKVTSAPSDKKERVAVPTKVPERSLIEALNETPEIEMFSTEN